MHAGEQRTPPWLIAKGVMGTNPLQPPAHGQALVTSLARLGRAREFEAAVGAGARVPHSRSQRGHQRHSIRVHRRGTGGGPGDSEGLHDETGSRSNKGECPFLNAD